MLAVLPVLFGFFVMGFCDIVGISSDYAREAFGWSHTMAGFVPSMVFIWFLFFSIPVGIKMNAWGRKNTVMLSMAVTLVGMLIPLLKTDWACLVGYALLGIGNTILQVSLNPLLNNSNESVGESIFSALRLRNCGEQDTPGRLLRLFLRSAARSSCFLP